MGSGGGWQDATCLRKVAPVECDDPDSMRVMEKSQQRCNVHRGSDLGVFIPGVSQVSAVVDAQYLLSELMKKFKEFAKIFFWAKHLFIYFGIK